ncbi:hypothetical protein [Enterobacter asburiae]|uniref:hypothetical protein n=1 Tax=Enterobacter asburiae TaxID=61645 RepID=UPI001E30BC05|nr:hypothetical protein [Enterobacter asburiae]MCE2004197.1 hypothetical protein [Enterobacter asburiae]
MIRLKPEEINPCKPEQLNPDADVIAWVRGEENTDEQEIKAAAGVRSELEGADKTSGELSRASRVIADLANAERDMLRTAENTERGACRSAKNRPLPEPFRKNVNLPSNQDNQAMKANKLAVLIVTTYIGFISMAHASILQPLFSPEQEARIGEIATDYLVSRPQVLVTVSNKEPQEAHVCTQRDGKSGEPSAWLWGLQNGMFPDGPALHESETSG